MQNEWIDVVRRVGNQTLARPNRGPAFILFPAGTVTALDDESEDNVAVLSATLAAPAERVCGVAFGDLLTWAARGDDPYDFGHILGSPLPYNRALVLGMLRAAANAVPAITAQSVASVSLRGGATSVNHGEGQPIRIECEGVTILVMPVKDTANAPEFLPVTA